MMRIIRLPLALSATSLCLLAATPAFAEDGLWEDGSVNAKVRGIHFDRDYENDSKDREQSAMGLELGYSSGHLGNLIGFDVTGYHVQELASSGAVSNDILTRTNDGELDNAFSKIGQAYLKLNLADRVSAKIGRQVVKTMLLSSSGTRAIPSSYSGVSINGKLADFELYGVRVDQWSSRHDDHFEGFRTDITETGAIDYISVFGAKYQRGNFTAGVEQLNSKDYLQKRGLRLGYQLPLGDSSLELSGGYFTSDDDGELFAVGAEKGEMDYADGVEPENHARAAYVDAEWKRGNLTLGGAFTAIRDDVWLEDNFTGDHGRNPFPTRSVIAPDLTGKNEDIWQLRTAYNWTDLVPGLTTKLSYTCGEGAENTVDKSLGIADEWYTELDVKWSLPNVKGLSLRWIAHDYHSDETGTVAQVKEDEFDNRFYMDYVYKF
ncbi:OprD family outer membrane porin [Microbulbifer sp.]|uniref:OprD family outer membrane porin n=1 Tax=Microbulbifer sp. TaxID=1908541 RepID=UPI003F673DCC